jgi:hypothetical protein
MVRQTMVTVGPCLSSHGPQRWHPAAVQTDSAGRRRIDRIADLHSAIIPISRRINYKPPLYPSPNPYKDDSNDHSGRLV